jgi:hypothetical protein
MFNLTTPFERLLSRKAKQTLVAFADGPLAQQAWAEAEAAAVAERTVLIKRLDALPAQHEPGCVAASKAVQKAAEAFEKAQAAVRDAATVHSNASVHATALSMTFDRAQAEVERALRDGADPRLAKYAWNCDRLFNLARSAPLVPVIENVGLVSTKLSFNANAAGAAMNALQLARERSLAMQMQALTWAQVTTALQAISNEIAPALAAVSLKPPALDADEDVVQIH